MKQRIIITSGYFDPIHVGHIEYIRLSKALGGKLIVILNNDDQCVIKKGRAFMPLEERKIILEEIKCIDEIFTRQRGRFFTMVNFNYRRGQFHFQVFKNFRQRRK